MRLGVLQWPGGAISERRAGISMDTRAETRHPGSVMVEVCCSWCLIAAHAPHPDLAAQSK